MGEGGSRRAARAEPAGPGLRRVARSAGLAGALALLVAGCTLPDGVDGDLAGDWGALPDPVGFVPDAGVCHAESYQESGPLADYAPIDCAQSHLTETAHVGEFSGEAAERVTPPPPGSSGWQGAYRQCDEAVASYLGADFRHGDLWLGVTVPSEQAWEGGARWLRCEVAVFRNDAEIEREGTLADALSGSSDLALGCFDATVDDDGVLEALDPISCTEPHNAEFVGPFHSDASSYPESDTDYDRVHRGCREQVAEFADVPVDSELPSRTGTIAIPTDEEDWDNGDRGIRCYLWLDGEELTESKAGVGPGGLPVQ